MDMQRYSIDDLAKYQKKKNNRHHFYVNEKIDYIFIPNVIASSWAVRSMVPLWIV